MGGSLAPVPLPFLEVGVSWLQHDDRSERSRFQPGPLPVFGSTPVRAAPPGNPVGGLRQATRAISPEWWIQPHSRRPVDLWSFPSLLDARDGVRHASTHLPYRRRILSCGFYTDKHCGSRKGGEREQQATPATPATETRSVSSGRNAADLARTAGHRGTQTRLELRWFLTSQRY